MLVLSPPNCYYVLGTHLSPQKQLRCVPQHLMQPLMHVLSPEEPQGGTSGLNVHVAQCAEVPPWGSSGLSVHVAQCTELPP